MHIRFIRFLKDGTGDDKLAIQLITAIKERRRGYSCCFKGRNNVSDIAGAEMNIGDPRQQESSNPILIAARVRFQICKCLHIDEQSTLTNVAIQQEHRMKEGVKTSRNI